MISIQASLTPHVDILQTEQARATNILKKDPNLSTLDGLVHLAAEVAIQIRTIDIALDNWDSALQNILDQHRTFLSKVFKNV